MLLLGLLLVVVPPKVDSAPATPTLRASVAEALEAGDAHYERRAEGALGGTAHPFHADGAIVEYRRALALDPHSLDARLRLMRVVFFRTGFCGPMEAREEVLLLDEAKRIAEEAVAGLDAETGRHKGRVSAGAGFVGTPAAETYLWAAVSWGQWAVYHRVSGAWQGAPKRIRDLGEAALAIDPRVAQAGTYIILGRLHCEAPRVPFLTGWVSREKGLAYLRQGLTLAPDNQAIVYFLADALLKWAPARRGEACALFLRCAAAKPRPDFLVEDAHYAEQARERLAALR
jgi:hypothetical protein